MVAMAPGSIEIACDSVTYGEAVAPTVTSNTNEGADVTFTYTGTDGTSYGPSSEAPEDAVPNASGYTVRLYKDGQAHGDAAVVTGTSHEFSIPEPGTIPSRSGRTAPTTTPTARRRKRASRSSR